MVTSTRSTREGWLLTSALLLAGLSMRTAVTSVGAVLGDIEAGLHSNSGVGPKDFNDVDYTAARFSVVLDILPVAGDAIVIVTVAVEPLTVIESLPLSNFSGFGSHVLAVSFSSTL